MGNSTKKSISVLGLTQVIAFFVLGFSLPTMFNSYHRLLELFSHFRFQYFVLSLLCALLFLAYKNYKSALVMAVVFSLNAVYILPWYFNSNDIIQDSTAIQLKLLHSNVNTANDDYSKLIDLIKQENPDIVLAQETNTLWVRELSRLEKIYPYQKSKPRADNFGIAIFSKYPFDKIEAAFWGDGDIPSLKADFMIAGQKITLISTHPLPPINSDFYLSRNKQLNDVAEVVKKEQNPVILIGDLNVSLWSDDYKRLEKKTGLINASQGLGILPTWPTMLPFMMIPIDHCLVSATFKVEDIYTGEDVGSDHLPLIVKLSFKKSL